MRIECAPSFSDKKIVAPKASLQAWLVCCAAALFFFYEFAQLYLFNAINPVLRHEFNLSATQISLLSSTFLLANIIFLIPAGLILDRFSTRKVILCAMLLCILSTFGFALTTSLIFLSFCRFLSGIGNAFCFLSCMLLVTRWFPIQQKAFAIGMVVTIGFLGGIVAGAPLTLLINFADWRLALLLDGLLGLVILGAIGVFVHDYPRTALQNEGAKCNDKNGDISYWLLLRAALSNPQNWLGGLIAGLLNLPIMVLAGLWGASYVVAVYHLSYIQGVFVSSMIFWGSILGCPLMGWYSDFLGRRKYVIVQGLLLSITVISLILFIPHLSYGYLVILFFLLGFFTSSQVIVYPMIAEHNAPSIAATAVAVASVVIMVTAAIGQNLFGALLDVWVMSSLTGSENFTLAMWLFPVAFIMALLAVVITRESRVRT